MKRMDNIEFLKLIGFLGLVLGFLISVFMVSSSIAGILKISIDYCKRENQYGYFTSVTVLVFLGIIFAISTIWHLEKITGSIQ